MAQKVQTFLIDDLDGSEAEGTVLFGLDGTQYETDLSTAHAKELRTALARYIDAGRKVTSTARRAGQNGRKAPASSISNTEVLEHPGFHAHLVLCDAASPGGSAVMRLPGLEPGPVFV